MSYLIDKATKSVVRLDQIPRDESGSSVLVETTDPHTGQYSVRFRKGEKNDKDVFIEMWSAADQKGFRSSLKATEKLTKVYNDTVFGGIQWSPDAKKIVFVGETPEVANYKPFFKDPEEPKKEDKDKAGAEEEKKGADAKKAKEHWQDDKFLYQENFGETLAAKKTPAIFIFDLEQNQLNQVQLGEHININEKYPQYPVFDQHSTGVVFNSVTMPIKKLGLNFCLNRPTSVLYIRDPKFKKEEVEGAASNDYVECLNPGEYLGMQARFSHDYSRLCYIGSEDKFLSHSGNYQLKYIDWSKR